MADQKVHMGQLFGPPENVLMHLSNVFSSAELEEEAAAEDFLAGRCKNGAQGPVDCHHWDCC